MRGAGGSFCVTGMAGWTGKGGDGGVFGKANTEVPLPPCGGQGQVMRARERVGPRGMACALGSPGVQGSSAVTLNQNRRLPFERLEGRRTGGQINTKVGSGVLHGLGARQNSLTPVPTVVCVCVCVCVCFRVRTLEVVSLLLPPLLPAIYVIYLPHISLSRIPVSLCSS